MNSNTVRICVCTPTVHLANPTANAGELLRLYREASRQGAGVVLFPELALSGATCGDLFRQERLLEKCRGGLDILLKATADCDTIMVLGCPIAQNARLYDAALVLQRGTVLAAAANSALGNARRQFTPPCPKTSAGTDCMAIYPSDKLCLHASPLRFGIEFGQELNSLFPPSSQLANSGVQAICCLDAQAECLGGWERTKRQILAQSERLHCLYAYASAGFGESSADVAYAGHAIIAMDGEILAENQAFSQNSQMIFADVIPGSLDSLRMQQESFHTTPTQNVNCLKIQDVPTVGDFRYAKLSRHPFIPDTEEKLALRSREILEIQANGLARRICATGAKRLVIGLSGGLDSTMALLACDKCREILAKPSDFILALTMPGMGTSTRTRNNAVGLATEMGAELREICIKNAVLQHFQDIGHDAATADLVYENSQARERTQILMDIANAEDGIVVGTGDLSEIAMGWCTYNGDHMSMYNVNGTLPKTLMRAAITQIAKTAPAKIAEYLLDVVSTPISPELLPGTQNTEDIIGNYDLHDFFLFHFIKYSETPDTICKLACHAFQGEYAPDKIKGTLSLFIRRFFTQQFKRNAMADGPSLGIISLASRNDWQMPSDASFTAWK